MVQQHVSKSAIDDLNAEGHNIGLIQLLYGLVHIKEIERAIHDKINRVFVFELNLGQMLEDVKLVVNSKVPVEFMGKVGGIVFTPEEVKEKLKHIYRRITWQ